MLAAGLAQRVTIVACAEHWTSVAPGEAGIRPGLEDQLGAGAIASTLAERGIELSAEAEAASAMFGSTRKDIGRVLADCVSGRELIANGFAGDVEVAAELDVTQLASVLDDDGFFRARAPRSTTPEAEGS